MNQPANLSYHWLRTGQAVPEGPLFSELLRDLARLESRCFVPETFGGNPWNKRQLGEALASSRPAWFLVVTERESGGRVLAWLLATDDFEGGVWLEKVAVEPTFTRRGLARRMAARLVNMVVTAGRIRIRLEVSLKNRAAIGFYRALGFQETGRRKNYYRLPTGERTDALIMELPLHKADSGM